jgi:peptide/nickel transport system permease protein
MTVTLPAAATQPARNQRRRAAHPVAMFLVRRLGAAALTLFVASFLIFLAVNVLPGDVAQVVLGKNANSRNLAAVRADLNLDQPLVTQYWHWLTGVLTGHFGNSTAALAQGTKLPVWTAIKTPLWNSLVLAGVTLVLFIPLCLVLGTIAALRAGKPSDHAVSSIALALGAMPEFLLGTVLIWIFFTQLKIFPPVSTIPPGQGPLADPKILALPVMTLLVVSTAFGTRLLRASIIECLREDYVGMARLSGINEGRVVAKYAMRNALAPSVQVLAQMIQYLVGGIIVVESVFNYSGIGNALVQSVQVRDVQLVADVAMLLATFYVILNVLADLAVVLLVPKVRTQL